MAQPCPAIEKKFKHLMFFPLSQLSGWVLDHLGRPYERVIFVASTGRSGTDSLSRIFECVPGLCARHEPDPVMHDRVMIEKNLGNAEPLRRLYRRVKRQTIRLGQLWGARYYAESNHMFIKSFAEEALADFGQRAAVVHLYRDPVGVAKSLYQLETIPGTPKGDRWYLNPQAPANLIKIAEWFEQEPFRHDFYRCLWYWYEIEARTHRGRQEHSKIPWLDFRTESLNNLEEVETLLQRLGLPYDRRQLEQTVGVRHNLKRRKKARNLPDQEATAMHKRFKQALIDAGWIEGIDANGMPRFTGRIA